MVCLTPLQCWIYPSKSMAPEEAMRLRRLQQRIVCTTEHSLSPVQRVDFSRPSLLSGIKVLQEPIALTVKRRDVLCSEHHFLRAIRSSLLVRLQRRLHVCLRGTLICQGLGIGCALRGRILHHLLVISLRVRLLGLRLGQLLLKIFDQEIDHGNDAIVLLGLRGVGSECFWGWARCVLALCVN